MELGKQSLLFDESPTLALLQSPPDDLRGSVQVVEPLRRFLLIEMTQGVGSYFLHHPGGIFPGGDPSLSRRNV